MVRYMAIGGYVGAATVGAASWWFMYSPYGPQMTYWQLTHHLQCLGGGEDFKVTHHPVQRHHLLGHDTKFGSYALDTTFTNQSLANVNGAILLNHLNQMTGAALATF